MRTRLIFLIILTGFLNGCENDIEKINVVTARSKAPAESMKDVEILYSDSAHVQVKVTAPRLDRYPVANPYFETPEGVKILFYNDSLQVKSYLTAEYAIRYEKEKKMEARRNVVVVNEKGEKLNTEHLIWDEAKQMIYSKEFVRITTPDEIIVGEGFEANQDFTKYKIFKIKGTFTVDKDSANAQ